MIIINVVPLGDYKIYITFDDGVSGVIDLKTFVENGIFSVLKNEDAFDKVYTNGYSVAWSDELEIDALTIYKDVFITKVNLGLKDSKEGRVFEFNDVKQHFFDKWD